MTCVGASRAGGCAASAAASTAAKRRTIRVILRGRQSLRFLERALDRRNAAFLGGRDVREHELPIPNGVLSVLERGVSTRETEERPVLLLRVALLSGESGSERDEDGGQKRDP